MPAKLGKIARYAVCVLVGAGVGMIMPVAATDSAQEVVVAIAAATAENDLPAPVEPLELRDAAITWDIANLDHTRVGYWIVRFQTDKRANFELFLERKGRYEPLITAALAERGMPRDLVYLAMIESGFNPLAYSKSRASGIWQFIRETGVRYGLDVNSAVDERNDPVKATQAALAYLSVLHGRFGSWYLAAAAYNTGENRVGRIMRQKRGSERGTDADYYAIWPHLPPETRDYVPLMVAAARISKQPGVYGFDYVKPLAAWAFEERLVAPGTSLRALARESGTTVKDLKSLNPQMKLERTRRDEPTTVRVPSLASLRDPGTAVAAIAVAGR